jgi:hypothetical protein
MGAATPVATAVLQFDPAHDQLARGARLSGGLSAAASVDGTLFLAHDETVAIEALRRMPSRSRSLRYAGHRRFDLRTFFALPARAAQGTNDGPPEADVEALSFADGYLWVAGSHSAQRDDAKGRSTAEAIDALARVRRSGNRFLLGRIPVGANVDGPTLARRAPGSAGAMRTAARLAGSRKNDALTRALRRDPHLGPFLALPTKDNGFDIEGLAAATGGRLFIGLRGPVIDGWACILELCVGSHARRPERLVLQGVGSPRSATGSRLPRYRKHFLDLGGGGVRDLCFSGRHLLILSGPPLRGKGTATIRLWRNALSARAPQLLHDDRLPTLLELPYRAKKDHPEAIAVLGAAGRRVRVIVVCDSADDARRVPPAGLRADIHDLLLP